MLTDYWSHQYLDNPKLDTEAIEDDSFDKDSLLKKLEQDPDSPDFDWEELSP